MTYNGYGGVRDGQGVIDLLTGTRAVPTKIPDNTVVDFANFFKNNAAMNSLQASIENSRVLTYADKQQIQDVVEFLERVARRGR